MEMHGKMPSYYNWVWFGSVTSKLKGGSITAAAAQEIRKTQCKYFHSKSEQLCGARVTRISLFPTTPIQLMLWRIVISGQIFLTPQTFPSSSILFPPIHTFNPAPIIGMLEWPSWCFEANFLPSFIMFHFRLAINWNDFQQASLDFSKWRSRL